MKKGLAILLSFFMVLSLFLPTSLTTHAEEEINMEYSNGDEDIEPKSNENNESTEDSPVTVTVEPSSAENSVEFEKFLNLVSEMPSVEEIKQMDEGEIDSVVDKYYSLLDTYDELTEESQRRFLEEYPQLYVLVFDDLAAVLADVLNAGVEVMSLLPLEEYYLYIDLHDKTREELENYSIEAFLNELVDENGNRAPISSDDKKLWKYEKNNENLEEYEEYDIIEGATLDLYPGENISAVQLEVIVGNNGQLNSGNKRFIIRASYTDEFELDFDMVVYLQDNEKNRTQAVPDTCNVYKTYYNDGAVEELNFDLSFSGSLMETLGDGDPVWIGFNSEIAKNPRVQMKIYPALYINGSYVSQGASIADEILNKDMNVPDNGYEVSLERNSDRTFLVQMNVDGEVYKTQLVCFRYWNWYPEHTGKLFINNDGNRENVYTDVKSNFDYTHKITTITYELSPDLSSTDKYYFDYDFVMQKNYGSADATNMDIYASKIVLGHYDSIDAATAANAVDVTDEVLSAGYLADYSGAGVDFTVFKKSRLAWNINLPYDTLADKIRVVAKENAANMREFTEVPIIGEADPWFRVIGAKGSDGNNLDTYIIENGKNINIDTMYGYGYQTIFINDSVDAFIPTFWKVNADAISLDNIYVNGNIYNEGDVLSFENEENEIDAVFSVIITDSKGPHTKNYNVRFVKKANGPKLYVAGPLAPEVRSIFLDEHHENKHDIFIANVGNAPLTDLWIDLDATNVQLDSYWRIGGAGNNILEACPANFNMELMESDFGELSNVAKIRLVPPESGKGGEIAGTLKIYSGEEGNTANSELLATIILSELAQNPEIITKELDDSVLYVPYSYLITTDNMYDWVDVSYEIIEGTLPNGVELIESTGEIYGVPLETGDFNVKIQANFDSNSENYSFTSSIVDFTLTVLDNTNSNVYNATDIADGYQILDPIGIDEGGYDYVLYEIEDTVYRSNGEFGEFVDLWLNGEKLIRDVDYEAESGSTKITIYSQTIDQKANQTGENTIAAEFRTSDTNSLNNTNNTNQLNRTSQNFRINTTCSHTYNAGVITQSANCTSNGVRTYTCTKCGNTRTESISATGHSYDSGVVTKEATYTTTGIRTFTCKKCGNKRTEVISVKNSSGNNNNGNGGSTGGANQNSNADNPNNNSSANGNNNSNKPNNNNTGAGNENDVNNTAENELQNEVSTGTATIQVVDRDGKPVSGKTLELHSTPQTAQLGADGTAIFDPIEFGEHTLYLKDSNGKTLAEKHISVVEGKSFSVNGDTVTAIRGENFTLKVCFDEDGTMSLKSVQRTSGPDTGDSTNVTFLWIMVFVSAMALIVLEVMRRKNIHK